MSMSASVLIADWQALGTDPCHIFRTLQLYNASAADSQNWTAQASELCLATEGCHWNQFSILTNSLCTNCPAICRSVHKSLNIVQFSIGALLFVTLIPINETCLWIIISNNLDEHEQVIPYGDYIYASNC